VHLRKRQEKELSSRRKGDLAKLRIPKPLREKATMTLGWIAERLQMGTKTHLAHLDVLGRTREAETPEAE